MLVYRSADLLFSTRIRAAAEDVGLAARPVRSVEMLSARLNRVEDGKCNDAVSSFVLELDGDSLAMEMIALARKADAQLPILAFGPHVDTDGLSAAQTAGASQVLTRGSFTRSLAEIMQALRQRADEMANQL